MRDLACRLHALCDPRPFQTSFAAANLVIGRMARACWDALALPEGRTV